jgi:hypothetical protein
MQICKQLPTFFRVTVTSSFGSGTPGTLAAQQMPKFYSVNGNAVSVEHKMAGINQKNTHFTATVM